MLPNQARKLEWLYYLSGKDASYKSAFFEELMTYQNPDGGFAYIELDLCNPNSTPIATSVALSYMVKRQIEKKHPMVKKTLAYLSHTPDVYQGRFCATVPSNNDYPRAVWWNHSDKSNDTFFYNPTVNLCAYALCLLDETNPFYRHLQAVLYQAIQDYLSKTSVDMHVLQNYVEAFLYAKDHVMLSETQYAQFQEKLVKDLKTAFHEGESAWLKSYVLLPVDVIDSPRHPFYPSFQEEVKRCIETFKPVFNQAMMLNVPWQWFQYETEFQKQKPFLDAAYTLKWQALFDNF